MASQTIGAAVAKDPRVQKAAEEAMREAASNPKVQAAAYNAAVNVGLDMATKGAAHARSGFIEIHAYVQESHFSVRILCFCVALALMISSVLGLLNIFQSPFQYLFAVSNIVFAGIIIIMDGKSEWFARCGDLQGRLFTWAAFLGTLSGRALFYFYVGFINLFILPESWLWKMIYVCIGGTLCFAGTLNLLNLCRCFGTQHAQSQQTAEGP